jgi:hypothetical protein
MVGATTYGFGSPPDWTDSAGVFHLGDWPECLPPMSSVDDLRIAADWLWVEGVGEATVFWVDCRGH